MKYHVLQTGFRKHHIAVAAVRKQNSSIKVNILFYITLWVASSRLAVDTCFDVTGRGIAGYVNPPNSNIIV